MVSWYYAGGVEKIGKAGHQPFDYQLPLVILLALYLSTTHANINFRFQPHLYPFPSFVGLHCFISTKIVINVMSSVMRLCLFLFAH